MSWRAQDTHNRGLQEESNVKGIKKEKYGIIIVTVICCVTMAFIETVIEPPYFVKSAAKIIVFLGLPLISMQLLHIKATDHAFALNKKAFIRLFWLGALIYFVIIGAYFLTGNLFDYAALVDSLSADQKVQSGQFLWVALYISFCNSFLEEFLFRFFSFLKLSQYMTKNAAYIFSSVLFAVYHIGMIGASFPLPLLILSLIGLTAGGWIFDYVDEKDGNIYHSWFIHMFADFAIMTIWYLQISQRN